MNVPALAARAPDGATHTIVGIGASRSADDDLLRGVEAPARGVEADDDGRRPIGGGLRDPLLEVAGEDVVDDAGRRQDDHRPARGADRPAGQQPDEPEQQRQREQEPADTTGHRDLRRPYRTAGASRYSKASRLHDSSRSATAATSAGSANAPSSLSTSRIATGRPAASAT